MELNLCNEKFGIDQPNLCLTLERANEYMIYKSNNDEVVEDSSACCLES